MKDGYSLDITRTALGTSNSLSEYLLAKTALFVKERGGKYLTLHFCAFSQHYRDDREEKGNPFWRKVGQILDKWFPAVSAYQFDTKFQTLIWKKRYFVYQSYIEFLRCGFAVVSAESALKIARPKERRKREAKIAEKGLEVASCG